jgi:hypothetical protein
MFLDGLSKFGSGRSSTETTLSKEERGVTAALSVIVDGGRV